MAYNRYQHLVFALCCLTQPPKPQISIYVFNVNKKQSIDPHVLHILLLIYLTPTTPIECHHFTHLLGTIAPHVMYRNNNNNNKNPVQDVARTNLKADW